MVNAKFNSLLMKMHKKESGDKPAEAKLEAPVVKPTEEVAKQAPATANRFDFSKLQRPTKTGHQSSPAPAKAPTSQLPTVVEEVPEAEAEPKVNRLAAAQKQELAKTIDVQQEIAGGVEGFKQRLELLNELILKDQNLGLLTYDSARVHVKQIMVDLKQQPELQAILIDRDVHNVLAFIRSTKIDAIETHAATKVKREARATNKKKKGGFGGDFDMGSPADMLKLPGSLDDFSKFEG